ncbi:hypothetical protein [Lysinibacillus capsici]|uniref:hypothetical protein n=1 Tax=Lysinibacillus capsici TaxID=2115968 RepID=UPI00248150AE|nr:hypothetical protein [Lysinibacillus capsici]
MKEVKEAIWLSIKDNILKKVWFKVVSFFVIVMIGFVLYKAYFSPSIIKGEIGNENTLIEYDSLASDFDKTSKTLDGIEVEVEKSDSGFDSRKMETVITEFFSMANMNNPDLFIASMNPEQIDADFSSNLLKERLEKIEEAMRRISRNSQLDKVEVVRSLWVLESKAVRVVLDIHYKDLKEPIRINLIVKTLEQYQFNVSEGETINLPYISSSVWDIIEMIEDK